MQPLIEENSKSDVHVKPFGLRKRIGVLSVVALALLFVVVHLASENSAKPATNLESRGYLTANDAPAVVNSDGTNPLPLPFCAPTNVALNKPAHQSSTWGGIPANRATQPGTGGGAPHECSHTQGQPRAWFYVDLGQSRDICTVQFSAVIGWAASRLRGFVVFVTDTPPQRISHLSSTPHVTGKICAEDRYGAPFTSGQTKTFACRARGRYVGVQLKYVSDYLQLCHFKVFAMGSGSYTVMPMGGGWLGAPSMHVNPGCTHSEYRPPATITATSRDCLTVCQNAGGDVNYCVWRFDKQCHRCAVSTADRPNGITMSPVESQAVSFFHF